MKKIVFTLWILLLTISMSAQKKNAKVQLEVDGVCGMCKERIEKAALITKGVKYASWSVETHLLSLIINKKKTSLKIIQENIAAVGHGSKEMECSLDAYKGLPACCKYKDKEVVKNHK